MLNRFSAICAKFNKTISSHRITGKMNETNLKLTSPFIPAAISKPGIQITGLHQRLMEQDNQVKLSVSIVTLLKSRMLIE